MTSDPQLTSSDPDVRLQVLQLVRDILHAAYLEQKAQIHNEWALRADIAWKTVSRVPPYPKLPDYFTEVDVLQKAVPLLQFVCGSDLVAETPPESHTPETTEEQPHAYIPEPTITQSARDVESDSGPQPVSPDLTTQMPPADAPAGSPNRTLRVLPAWLKSRNS
jgi:hypothetical protein